MELRTRPTVPTVAAGVAALAGAALLLTGLLNEWVAAYRLAIGGEIADVNWYPDAWAGFFWPALPTATLAGAVLLLAGLLATRFLWAALVAVAAGAVATGLLLGLLAGPSWPTVIVNRVAWEATPGRLVWVGMALAILGTGSAWIAWVAGSRRPSRGEMAAGLAAGVVPLVLLAIVIAATPAVTPPAVGGVPVSRIPPLPDWREDPEEPYPFVTPVPHLVPTTADGVYARPPTDHDVGVRAHCTRCAPFPRDYGESVLTLKDGRYEILQEDPSYRAAGHYAVAGDRIRFFNDPECGRVEGLYRWRLEDGELSFEVIDDPCAFGQRARDLIDTAWRDLDPG